METRSWRRALSFTAVLALIVIAFAPAAFAQLSGALFTSNPDGTQVNGNLYDNKTDVYLNGGPQNGNCTAAALPDGEYYFLITDPSGVQNLSAADPRDNGVITFTGGAISKYVGSHNTGTGTGPCAGSTVQLYPYDDTPNPGGVYKVWVTPVEKFDSSFACGYGFCNSDSKTDNYKIKANVQGATVTVCKFIDTNLDGIWEKVASDGITAEPAWPWKFNLYGPDIYNQGAQSTDSATGCTSFSVVSFDPVTGSSERVTISESAGDSIYVQSAPATASSCNDPVAAGNPSISGCVVTCVDANQQPIACPFNPGGGGVSRGPDIAPDTIVPSGAGPSVQFDLHPGDHVTVPFFGNLCLAIGSCVYMPVTKDVNPVDTVKYEWTLDKSVDKTKVDTTTSATFTYTLAASHDAGVESWKATGTVKIENPTEVGADGVTLTDVIDNGGTCLLTGQTDPATPLTLLVPAGQDTYVDYACTYTSAPTGWPTTTNGTNTATMKFGPEGFQQTDSTGPVGFGPGTPYPWVYNVINGSMTLGDTNNPACLPAAPLTGQSTDFSCTYSLTFPAVRGQCVDHPNTATLTPSGATDALLTKTVTVTVCGPLNTGALTMGYWQNKNGQAQIIAADQADLASFLTGYNPFKDYPAKTGQTVAAYVANVIKLANASGASMNAMLKAQMLATALDVYFNPSLGAVTIDLTQIYKDASNPGLGFENAGPAFGSATSMTVSDILEHASLQATPATSTNPLASLWYGDVKATQELAKDTFDAINNQVVFAP